VASRNLLSSEDLRFFTVVAGAPSLASASRALDVSRAAVGQRLANLEQRLRCRLLERSTRHVRLTEEGLLLLGRADRVLRDLDEIVDTLGVRTDVISGHLRVAAPLGFGRKYVSAVVGEFRRLHPEVTVTLTLTDRPTVSAHDHYYDLVIHIGELRDSSLVMVRLAPNARIACASPDYLHRQGEPVEPHDLGKHACLALRENEEDVTLWRFTDRNRKIIPVRVSPVMASNDGDAVRSWALSGLGVIVRSEWDVADDIRGGRLRRVLPGYRLPAADIVAFLGKRGGRTARAKAFLTLLKEALQPVPWRSGL
jgi:DNA-binding transcriptional LysR family regulator